MSHLGLVNLHLRILLSGSMSLVLNVAVRRGERLILCRSGLALLGIIWLI